MPDGCSARESGGGLGLSANISDLSIFTKITCLPFHLKKLFSTDYGNFAADGLIPGKVEGGNQRMNPRFSSLGKFDGTLLSCVCVSAFICLCVCVCMRKWWRAG